MGKIKYLDSNSLSFVLNKLNEEYQNSNIEGIVVGIKCKDGSFITASSDEISYLEKLGLSQSIISDINFKTYIEE